MSDIRVIQCGLGPIGLGLIGALQKEQRSIRVANIAADPRRVGFPLHHPEMHSFLGVPILATSRTGDRVLGQIYLTDKLNYSEFTEDDERVIETLAAYAAVAINNAEMYEDLLGRDRTLMQRNEDLALVNDVAASLSSSLDENEILNQTLTRVMAYLGVEAGEIFLVNAPMNCAWLYTAARQQTRSGQWIIFRSVKVSSASWQSRVNRW